MTPVNLDRSIAARKARIAHWDAAIRRHPDADFRLAVGIVIAIAIAVAVVLPFIDWPRTLAALGAAS